MSITWCRSVLTWFVGFIGKPICKFLPPLRILQKEIDCGRICHNVIPIERCSAAHPRTMDGKIRDRVHPALPENPWSHRLEHGDLLLPERRYAKSCRRKLDQPRRGSIMGGLNNSFIERVLGYDDDYRSTQATRDLHWVLFNCCNAQPYHILQLQGTHIVVRPPGNRAEEAVARLVARTLQKMRD